MAQTTVSVIDIIGSAFRIAGIMGAAGRTMIPEYVAEGLGCLNSMIDSWKAESAMVYAQKRTEVPIVPNKASYTIGATGADISLERPEKINGAGFIFTSTTPPVEYQLLPLTDQEWRATTPKSLLNSSSSHFYYSAEVPVGVFYPWPIPNQGNSFALYTWEVLQEFGSDGDEVVVAPAYREALEYNLALALAERNPKLQAMSATSVDRAKKAKAKIKGQNGQHLLMKTEVSNGSTTLGNRHGRFNIFSNRWE